MSLSSTNVKGQPMASCGHQRPCPDLSDSSWLSCPSSTAASLTIERMSVCRSCNVRAWRMRSAATAVSGRGTVVGPATTAPGVDSATRRLLAAARWSFDREASTAAATDACPRPRLPWNCASCCSRSRWRRCFSRSRCRARCSARWRRSSSDGPEVGPGACTGTRRGTVTDGRGIWRLPGTLGCSGGAKTRSARSRQSSRLERMSSTCV
mmetsp:Transcript_79272/g.256645  ORF Transcript_79272/g.256645 Transcript_79272/m.256645 type:complete len:209 (+) Transcript_79272:225-851(+)